MTIQVQDFMPQEKSTTSTDFIKAIFGARSFFTGSIANLSTSSVGVLQALVDSGGTVKNFFIRPGDRMNFVNMRMNKIEIKPAVSTSQDSGSAASVYAKMYGKILAPETDTEEMHLNSNSWVEYVQGGSVLLQGTVTVSVTRTALANTSTGGTTSGTANTYTAIQASSTPCKHFQIWYPKAGTGVLSISALAAGTTASRVAELSPQQGFAFDCMDNETEDLASWSVASTIISDTYDGAYEN